MPTTRRHQRLCVCMCTDYALRRAAVKGAGIDMAQLDADLKAHDADISTLLKRNTSEADSLGLQATPVFLIGPFKVEKALDYDEFKATAADTGGASSCGTWPSCSYPAPP